ncbi:hypothetical protein KF728_16665 [Candidatus Obscuribacterales bacterium]|nr:hypothetical protein [Candidatus Obscuribacterales bacterium]
MSQGSGPLQLTFKVNELDKATQFYGEQYSAAGGAVLVLKNIEVYGSEALYGIFKYRATPGQMPLMYVGIILSAIRAQPGLKSWLK